MKTASKLMGNFFVRLRDSAARGLLAVGITPNMLTITGTAVTIVAAVAVARGQWLIAGCVLLAAGAGDMLDGAVARVGNRKTSFGGVLDSACDRLGDIALLGGFLYYYLIHWPAEQSRPPNLTYGLLALMAIINGTLISYIRARAETEGVECDVGFWKRGERYVAFIIAVFARNPAMLLWELGLWSGLTALHRLLHARRAIAGRVRHNEERSVVGRLLFFDEPRGSLAYDLHTGAAIVLLLFARVPETDLLRMLAEKLTAG